MTSSCSRLKVWLIPCGLALLLCTTGALGVGIWLAYRIGSSLLHPAQERPTLRLRARYDGASANEIEQTVVLPLETQLAGMENLEAIESISQDDKATVILYLRRGADLEVARVVALNRVALALPILPDVVKRNDIPITRGGPSPALWLFVTSPDGSRDELSLRKFAHTKLLPELKALPGWEGATLGWRNDHLFRLRINPQRLAARNLTASDVEKALPQLGKGFLDDWQKVDALLDVVLGMDEKGRPVRVREVGEIGTGDPETVEFASWQGANAVTIVFEGGDAGAMLSALEQHLPALRQQRPAGTSLHLLSGPAVPQTRGLILEVRLPPEASSQRVQTLLRTLAGELRQLADVRAPCLIPAVVTLPTEEPAAFRLYAALCPSGERASTDAEVEAQVRDLLSAHHDVAGRVMTPEILERPPQRRAPIVLVLKGEDFEQATRLADTIRERLTSCADVVDVWPEYSRFRTRMSITVDHEKARQLGVAMRDVLTFLTILDPTLQRGEEIKALKVHSAHGSLVPLGAIIKTQEITHPSSTLRLNGERCLLITARTAAGIAVAQARNRCLEIAEQAIREGKLGEGYTVECTGSE
jgi:multidrug efflux pump subunit AcrB